jgi:hypothetical protein
MLSCQLEPGLHIPDPVGQQPHRRGLGWVTAGGQQLERLHPPFPLAAHPQHRPAGDQQVQPGIRLK